MNFPEITVTALLGQACGDAFGCPFEFHAKAPQFARLSLRERRYLRGKEDCNAPTEHCRTPGLYSDDTQQSLVLLWVWERLAAKGYVPQDQPELSAQSFTKVCQRMAQATPKGLGVHRGTGQNFRNYVQSGKPVQTAGLGAAMRVGPVATLLPDALLLDWVYTVSAQSTSDQSALVSACCLAAEAWVYAHPDQEPRFQSAHLRAQDWELMATAIAQCSSVETLLTWAEGTGISNRKLVGPCDGLGFTGVAWVISQVREAVSFTDAMRRVSEVGGDTDTACAMAGCLAALRFGRGDIPKWMTEGLVGLSHLEDPGLWHPITTELGYLQMDNQLRNSLERKSKQRRK